MRTILYVGSSTDLSYEHDLLEEWGKRGVTIAQVSALNVDDADATAEPAPDPLQDVDVVVLESDEMNSELLESHPDLSAVVILDDKAKVDVEAATRAEIWVTHAATTEQVQNGNRAVSAGARLICREHPLEGDAGHGDVGPDPVQHEDAHGEQDLAAELLHAERVEESV